MENMKFVDEGHIITSAGISAGINMSFHIVKNLLGVEIAEETVKIWNMILLIYKIKKAQIGLFLILSVYRYDLCSKLKLLNSHSSFIECTKMHLFSSCNHVKTRRTLYVKLFYNSRKRITETTILCQHT